MKQKGLAPILIIFLVVISLVGGYLVYKYVGFCGRSCIDESKVFPNPASFTKQSPQPTPTPDETTNWKTYTNKRYRYSIKYPASWFICNSDDTIIFINSQQTDCGSAGLNDVSIFVDDKSDLTAQFELKKSNASKLSQINFAGVEATKSAETGNIYIFNGNYLYTVNGWTRLNPNTSNVGSINQILSTFKFQ